MRRRTLTLCALLALSTLGCDKIKQAIDKRRGVNRTPATPTHTATPPGDTTKRPAPAAAAPPPPVAVNPPRPAQDTPYDSPDTGTVAPGMSERDVYALWGAPLAVRRSGEYTYLFFRNACERTCGTMDLVTLQNGQVVDAIVRWEGHGYSGQSSSPPGRHHGPSRGGDTTTPPPNP
jgi:hypothetical protein